MFPNRFHHSRVWSLADHKPEALIMTEWYFLTMHMGKGGRDDHCKLRYGDLALVHDEQ